MKSDLPNSSQFSPVQTPLPRLLTIVREQQPDRKAASLAILNEFFPTRRGKTKWAWKLADNTIIAMSQYGLVDKPKTNLKHVMLTPLGTLLSQLADQRQEKDLYDNFARHILLKLRGLDLIATIEDLTASGQVPTKHLIIQELARRKIYHPPNGTHANGMRQWLEKAGIVAEDGWAVNRERLDQILGMTTAEVDELANLTREQRDFARAFARLDTPSELSNKVAQYATTLFGTDFPEGGLPQSVLFALRDAGLIECEKTTAGQGAKPYVVRPTALLRSSLLEPILDAIEQSAGIQYRRLIRMKYDHILQGLYSSSRHEKGIALEALAFYLARLLGLQFVMWRLRSSRTGGGELDVVMEGERLIFSRWQIQCKNASEATLDDVAKEVGLAQLIRASVIMIVTTGRIGRAAKEFSREIMRETSLHVILLDGGDLKHLLKSPADIAAIMGTQAHGAMVIKREQLEVL